MDTKIVDSILDNYKSLYWIVPMLCIVVTLLVNLVIQLIAKTNRINTLIRICSVIGLGCGIYAILVISLKLAIKSDHLNLFNNLLSINSWSTVSHLIIFSITLFMLLIPISNRQSTNPNSNISISIFMVVTTLLGTYLMIIAHHWLVVYLGLGCMTIGATTLIYGNGTNQIRILASMRYLVYSMVASAVMLLGLSYLYGSTGSLMINHAISYNMGSPLHAFLYHMWPIGFFLGISGLLMTLGSFPFQFWVPAVYQPTSFSVIAYLSSVPKIAVIAFLVQLHQHIILSSPLLKDKLENLWAILAILTMVVGHLGALKTSDAKKLLAYGTIAQTGLLLAFVVTDTTSYISVPYYLIIYTIMNWACWLGLKWFKDTTNSVSIKDYAGLGRQFPITSICFLITMVALIGLPPTAGFTAKFILFSELWEKSQTSENPLITALFYISVLGSLFALYYYLKIPYTLFFKPKKLHIREIKQQTTYFIVILLNVLLLGLFFGSNLLTHLLNRFIGI
jgi:NADH-quinone oxidoreductase subunit N